MAQSQERPEWLNEGLVFASVQEPLIFRIRRGDKVYVDAEERYEQERSEERVRELAECGVTLAVTNAHKAFGFETEEEDIESAVRYAELCHKYGIKVGVYIGETLAYETLFREVPEARDWLAVRYDGKQIYWLGQTFRLVPCKNHPGWINFQKRVTKMAIERIKADFLHYDNVYVWPEPDSCQCAVCEQKFRDFLAAKYTPDQLKKRLGFGDLSGVKPPAFATEGGGRAPRDMQRLTDPLQQEWVDFRCQALSDMYAELCDYARSLKPDIVLECNPVTTVINQAFRRGVDIPRLVRHGHCFWVEDGNSARLEADGRLISNIRTYKMARTLDNAAFAYLHGDDAASVKLRVAEAMAFNLDCIGPAGGSRDHPAREFISFFRERRELYAETQTLADVAVLRSFQSLAWDSFSTHLSTLLVEQALIQNRVPFHIIFDEGLDDLSQYRTLILADVEFMSDAAIEKVQRYVEGGGAVVVIGKTALNNEIGRRRHALGFADFLETDGASASRAQRGDGRAVHIPEAIPRQPLPERLPYWVVDNRYWHLPQNADEILEALKWCVGGRFSVELETGANVVIEIAKREQPPLLILHVVNYDLGDERTGVPASIEVPVGSRAVAVRFLDPTEGVEQEVPFDVSGNRVSFELPRVMIYSIAVIDLRADGE